MFQVVRSSPVPLGDQLVEEVTRLIESKRLPEGARLPSVRSLARRAGVSVYTVSSAYERLSARGLIQARPGWGYVVSRPARSPVAPRVELGPSQSADSALGFARRLIEQDNIVVPAGAGFLPADWLADAIPSSVLSRFGRSGAAGESAPVQGDPELRALLAERLRSASVPVLADQLIVTFGATHAFDLIARTLLSRGDAVLVDDPGYFVLPTQLKAHGARLISVPRQRDGSDLAALEEAAKLHRPRMFFTQTLLHNPTGMSASPANCHGVLTLAERYDFLVTEDHVYSDLASAPLVSLAQIDELRRVLYVGSFTKVLGPGLRIGFLAVPAALVPRLIEAKILSVLSGSGLGEFVLREVLASGKYRRHVERLRDRLAKARAATAMALGGAGLQVEATPGQGIFLWARLPACVDPDRLALEAQAAGILLANGALFSPSGQSRDCLRFNDANGADPRLARFLSAQTGNAA